MPRPILDEDVGMKVLVESHNAKEDILAIHGRGAHPDDTWCSIREHNSMGHTEGEDKYINWLSDHTMLPNALPTARIMRFGYRSAWYGTDRLFTRPDEIVITLLQQLKALRHSMVHQQHQERRPLIIVAHSYGGIVVMQMLLTARNDYPEIYESITGLVFFGTPFRGSARESQEILLQLAAGANEEIAEGQLDITRTESPYLRSLFIDFQQALRDMVTPRVTCFYEQMETNLGVMFMKKTNGQASEIRETNRQRAILWVDGVSATLDLTNRAFKSIPRSCNHLRLNKYQLATHSDFITLVGVLQTMAREGPDLIQQRMTSKKAAIMSNSTAIDIWSSMHTSLGPLDRNVILYCATNGCTKGIVKGDRVAWNVEYNQIYCQDCSTNQTQQQGHRVHFKLEREDFQYVCKVCTRVIYPFDGLVHAHQSRLAKGLHICCSCIGNSDQKGRIRKALQRDLDGEYGKWEYIRNENTLQLAWPLQVPRQQRRELQLNRSGGGFQVA